MSGVGGVAGYVEAVTDEAVLGWAWSPARPDIRLEVGLYLGDACVARATADREREDLAKNGIGDGRHAFALTIPPDARGQVAALTVKAGGTDEAPVVIGAPPAPPGITERLDQMQRMLDMLIGSQRLLHRTLHAALAKLDAPEKPGEDTAPVAERLRAIEVALMRLDERFVGHDAAVSPPRKRFGVMGAALTLALLCLVGSLWELRLALGF